MSSFQFLLAHTVIPRRIENNTYSKIFFLFFFGGGGGGGANKVLMGDVEMVNVFQEENRIQFHKYKQDCLFHKLRVCV